jgi:hypothetical protein
MKEISLMFWLILAFLTQTIIVSAQSNGITGNILNRAEIPYLKDESRKIFDAKPSPEFRCHTGVVFEY